jgi:hypothetical protein
MSQLTRQSLFLLASFALVFLWEVSPLSQITVPALGFLVFLYLILSTRQKKRQSQEERQQRMATDLEASNIFILNTIILLLIFATGSLDSPLYFLLYFIAFGISFVLVPETVFVFMIGCMLIFLPSAFSGNVAENLIKVASLGLLSPLAYFFGREFRAREEQKVKNEEAAQKITQEAATVLMDKDDKLSVEDKEILADLIQTGEELRSDES